MERPQCMQQGVRVDAWFGSVWFGSCACSFVRTRPIPPVRLCPSSALPCPALPCAFFVSFFFPFPPSLLLCCSYANDPVLGSTTFPNISTTTGSE